MSIAPFEIDDFSLKQAAELTIPGDLGSPQPSRRLGAKPPTISISAMPG